MVVSSMQYLPRLHGVPEEETIGRGPIFGLSSFSRTRPETAATRPSPISSVFVKHTFAFSRHDAPEF
jgi:hypothetical protein